MDAKGDCHLLFVPVRESGSGMLALRTGRLPSGQRVGLAFTSAISLVSELGPGQPWIRLHEDAMRDMLGPAGIDEIRVHACLSAPPGAPGRRRSHRTGPSAGGRRITPASRRAAPAPDSAVPLRFAHAGPRGTRRWRSEGPTRPWRLQPAGTARHPHTDRHATVKAAGRTAALGLNW